MKKLSKVLGLGAVALVLASNSAHAEGDVIGDILTKGGKIFKGVRQIVFVLGGFGLIGLAMAAIFGKIQWKWFGALAVGLTILAVAGSIVDYVTDSGEGAQYLGK